MINSWPGTRIERTATGLQGRVDYERTHGALGRCPDRADLAGLVGETGISFHQTLKAGHQNRWKMLEVCCSQYIWNPKMLECFGIPDIYRFSQWFDGLGAGWWIWKIDVLSWTTGSRNLEAFPRSVKIDGLDKVCHKTSRSTILSKVA